MTDRPYVNCTNNDGTVDDVHKPLNSAFNTFNPGIRLYLPSIPILIIFLDFAAT